MRCIAIPNLQIPIRDSPAIAAAAAAGGALLCHCRRNRSAGKQQEVVVENDDPDKYDNYNNNSNNGSVIGSQMAFEGSVRSLEAGKMRLDAWLASQLPNVSRARLQSSIRFGLARVNGHPVKKVSHTVYVGDHVKCTVAALAPLMAEAEDISLDIVYEDDHVLVVNKPAQMVTHPAPGNWHGTLVNALVHHCELPGLQPRTLSSSRGTRVAVVEDGLDELEDMESVKTTILTPSSEQIRPGIVHRLDKGTSGLLVIAKDEHAHCHLSEQFKARTVKRSYVSLTIGVPSGQLGHVDVAIARDLHNRTRMAAVLSPNAGRKARSAVSRYEVTEVLINGGSALVEWKLETGRTHQIRVHAQHLGHPLLGDETYGATKHAALACMLPKVPSFAHASLRQLVSQLERPCLHAATLSFIHPQTGKEMMFTSPLPSDFEDVWLQLQKLTSSLTRRQQQH